ncbi:WxL domain-containing protein [Vagococcus xieshaowenii]|uniref:WxL domain-containing protein n=1 Tax=Vagococcus xieshaowenii TaxID=2562451 RepID=A0AAJ5EDE9_9ENTE|nr:WxL domain-containing protein [Vagococcus xieshaowenii]QCA29457.1 WxL domain-containing protein [Vagococcus xieshaowenii]TFZ39616.1 WxL domain-containing protein [Vagococcus xieshaowenii]
MKKINPSLLALWLVSSFTTVAFAQEDSSSITSNGHVQFIPSEDTTLPLHPENPDPEVPVSPWNPTDPEGKPEPGTPGPLSIDFVSTFDFGTNEISNKDQTYYANPQYYANDEGTAVDTDKKTANYLQVTDLRGGASGWRLTVKQLAQFENQAAKYPVLDGAEIRLVESQATSNVTDDTQRPTAHDVALTPGEMSVVMQADSGEGFGTWLDSWGKIDTLPDGREKNTGVQFFIPGSTPKDAVNYQTEFVWTLTDAPDSQL